MNFIENAKGLTRNPLGIIALFISLIYGFACLVLSTSLSNLIGNIERQPLIWFIILFPLIILVCFIYLVTHHHEKLYSPDDYGNSEAFLKTLNYSKYEAVQFDVVNNEGTTIKSANELVKKFENTNLNKGIFSPITQENLQLANDFFRNFYTLSEYKTVMKSLSQLVFGAQAPEYFTLQYTINKELLNHDNSTSSQLIIIRVTSDKNGLLQLIGIGKNIIESNPKVFAIKIMSYIEDDIKKFTKI
jgi:hypothetical protein